jgi:hypothetical protein
MYSALFLQESKDVVVFKTGLCIKYRRLEILIFQRLGCFFLQAAGLQDNTEVGVDFCTGRPPSYLKALNVERQVDFE